jgi:hypothetical protein
VAQHALMLAWYLGVCLLLYALVWRLTDDPRAALAAAAVLAAWHTCTELLRGEPPLTGRITPPPGSVKHLWHAVFSGKK